MSSTCWGSVRVYWTTTRSKTKLIARQHSLAAVCAHADNWRRGRRQRKSAKNAMAASRETTLAEIT
eukprot:3703814-Pleurochrysis_carterae.AAC.2